MRFFKNFLKNKKRKLKAVLPNSLMKIINETSFDSHLRSRILEWGKFDSFTKFVAQNEKKIINKLKAAKEIEDKRDIGIELYIGFIFSDTNCEVVYEPDVPIRSNPDFKICYNEGKPFFLEVKRIRKYVIGEVSNEEMLKRCGDIICEKIIQTVPSSTNLIYIRSSGFGPWVYDFKKAVKNIFEWMESDPQSFLEKIKRNSISSIESFKVYWRQLSGIVLPNPENNISAPHVGILVPHIWENPDASEQLNPNIKLLINNAIRKPFRYDDF